MSKKMQFGSIVGAAVMLSAMSSVVHADVNPFASQEISASMQLAGNEEGKCGAHGKGDHEGKCGGEAKDDHEGKCGEGKASPAPEAASGEMGK
jgi:uncharacterized low-complexity protein